ncbi:MAG: hypothetical protein WCO55_05440 [Candidatus Falkowbacteria bacterium]
MEQKKCQKCGSAHIVGLEYAWPSPESYDGVSEWDCRDCKARFGRWSGKELAEGEIEKRYGRK